MMKLETMEELKKWCKDISDKIEEEQKREEKILEELTPKLYGDDLKYAMHKGSARYFEGFVSALKQVIELIE